MKNDKILELIQGIQSEFTSRMDEIQHEIESEATLDAARAVGEIMKISRRDRTIVNKAKECGIRLSVAAPRVFAMQIDGFGWTLSTTPADPRKIVALYEMTPYNGLNLSVEGKTVAVHDPTLCCHEFFIRFLPGFTGEISVEDLMDTVVANFEKQKYEFGDKVLVRATNLGFWVRGVVLAVVADEAHIAFEGEPTGWHKLKDIQPGTSEITFKRV